MQDFIQRISSPIGRLYWIEKEELLFPSVTTILSMYEDPELKELEEKLGKEKWIQVSTIGSNRGTCMHTFLENYFSFMKTSKDANEILNLTLEKTYFELLDKKYTEHEINRGRNLFWNFYYDGFFNNIKQILWSERFIYSKEGLYAGAGDFGYLNFSDKIIGSDFKSASKKKKDVPTYKMQISAYCKGIEERTNLYVDKGEILISSEVDNQLQVFELNKDEIEFWYKEFLKYRDIWFSKFSKEIEIEKNKLLDQTSNKLF